MNTTVFPLLVLLTTVWNGVESMCPTKCQCNDDQLHASCTAAGLQVVPIQLNPELRHINLSHNKINSVHFTLEIYANLITLDISSNRIQKLGSLNFNSQSYLNTLNLSNNEIENLEKDAFKGLKSLKVLDLSANRIEDISSNAFNDIPVLEVLMCNDNRIVSFEPDLFKHQSKLRVLQLDDNQLLEIPANNLAFTKDLHCLSMSRNLVEFIEEFSLPVLKSLRYLNLDSNVITEIHASAFDGFASLESLNLSDNNLTSVPTSQLSKLSNLLELNLNGNFFSNVPSVAFRGLFKLRHLSLNGIETLNRIDVRAFVDNINLERVEMNDNIALRNIPTRLFHGNPKLNQISIRNNMLQSIETTHFPLDQLVSLQIGDNPLQCNCSLMWLWKLVTEQHITTLQNQYYNPSDNITNPNISDNEMMLDINAIRCATPENLADILLVDTLESDIRCSLNWIAIATGSTTGICVLIVVVIILFYSGVLRSSNNKNYLRRDHQPQNQNEISSTSDRHGRDKCEHMIAPPLLSEYQSLPTWENYSGGKDIDMYRQFGYHSSVGQMSRPHVVYV